VSEVKDTKTGILRSADSALNDTRKDSAPNEAKKDSALNDKDSGILRRSGSRMTQRKAVTNRHT